MRALIPLIPDFLVKFFARPYVAGDSLEQGLEVTRSNLEQRGLLTSLDLLAEETRTRREADGFLEVYHRMVDACAGFPDLESRPSISLKPSSFTTHPRNGTGRGTADGSEEAIRAIVAHARRRGVEVTIDMEDRHWTDWTLDITRKLHSEGYRNVGTVLQTRLNRTEEDLKGLPEELRIRLVIGIYIEPPDVAIRDKREMKERMLRAAAFLLKRGNYVEFATHDQAYVRRFLQEVVPAAGVGPDRYEIQMIYGVPRRKFHEELVSGRVGNQGPVRTRIYVPFAISWNHALAYCRRRFIENPSIASAIAMNLGRIWTGPH